MEEKVEQLVDYIMKKCLWQFQSRVWDREKQNEGIITRTSQILCDEPVEKETPQDKCYWVDAEILARAYKDRFDWIKEMSKDEIKTLMGNLKERIDFLTITGSLNEELTVAKY